MTLAIAATNTYSENTQQTSHPVNLPASISAGDLLLVFVHFNGNPTVTNPAGWTVLADDTEDANQDRFRIYAKIADGSEGSTVTVTLNTAQRGCGLSYRITGNRNGVTSSEIAKSTVVSEASTATPNPPNLTPSWGSAENLWIAVTFTNSSVYTFSSYPTNYDLGQLDVHPGSNSNSTGISVAARLLSASSEDPGVFTTVTARDRATYTLAVRPAITVGSLIYNPSSFLPFLVR